MDFIGWAGWGFVGAFTQILSLLAIVFAINEISARARRYPPAAWNLSRYGWVNLDISDVGADEYEYVKHEAFELSNIGTGFGTIRSIAIAGAVARQQGEHRIQWMLGSGERTTLLIRSDDFAKAWMFISWSENVDRRFVFGQWFPLSAETELSATWEKQWKTMRKLRWYNVWRRGRNPLAVGPVPGGVVRSSIRHIKDEAKFNERSNTLHGAVLSAASIQFLSPSLKGGEPPATAEGELDLQTDT